MKQITLLIVLLYSIVAYGQLQPITISTGQTSSLIFPFPIRHVDRGTKDVLVQQVKETDNILLVKAAVKQFTPTNLSVITNNGQVYSFALSYAEQPTLTVHTIPAMSGASVAAYAQGILDNSRTMNGPRDRSLDLNVAITGIYIRSNTIYYQLHLQNTGPIDYDVDFMRYYIRDLRKSKRTATQENEIKPLHVAGNVSQVQGYGSTDIVVAFEKFTIPDAKQLVVELKEKNGGRHLLLKVKNKHIIRARPLPLLR